MARPARRGQGGLLPPTPRSWPPSAVRFHRHRQPRRHHRRRAVPASPVPFPAGLQRLGACAGDSRRRELFRRRRRLAGRALEVGRRPTRAPNRLAVGGLQEPRPRRPTRFTKRYDELCRHYGMEATRNNPGVANENGSIEASNGHIKIRLDQRLRRRGSRDFDSLEAYRAFVDGVCERYNARRAKPVAAERETLKALPKRRTTDFAMVTAKVTRNSTINVDRVIYSVPSRLIGHKLEVHLFDDRLECFLGPDPVMRMTRVRPDRKRGHSIDYHHLIGTLRRKPQALRYLVYREALFPSAAYARAWTALDDALPPRDACRTMVGLLVLASIREACEIALAARLDAILDAGRLPDLAELETEFATRTRRSSEVEIPAPNLDDYNRLLPSAWERRL